MKEIPHDPEKDALDGLEHQPETDVRALEQRIADARPLAEAAKLEQRAEETPEHLEQSEWVDTGVRNVNVADLPESEGIHGQSEFQKVSAGEMSAGLERLQEMQPAIRDGEGASGDYWTRFDKQRGLDYEHGYRRIYDAFYGQDAIRLNKDGNQYDIINGRHRIWLAKRMGIETLPARVIERRYS